MRYVTAILVTLLFASSIVGLEANAQPNQFNITNVQPNTIYAGSVVAVNGGQFVQWNGTYGSRVYLGNTALRTHFESQNTLVAVIPVGSNYCGEQGIIVKTVVNLNNNPATVESNFVVKVVNCSNPNNPQPDNPEINTISLLDPISGHSIELNGENFIPNSIGQVFIAGVSPSYPLTRIRMYNEGYEFEGIGEYRSYGKMRFSTNEEVYCGLYNVEARNYFGPNQSSLPSPPSNKATIRINERCTGGDNGNAPPENGLQTGYEVYQLNLPDMAYVNDSIQGNVEIKHIGTSYATRVDMKLYVDGELRDTEEIFISGNETKRFPLQFRFDRPGNYEIEIRVNESYKKQSIRVESQNGNGPPSNGNTPPPSGGGSLSSYDSDNDCKFNDAEFFNVLDAWLSESITNSTFFSGVDAWLGETNVCSASSSSTTLKIQMNQNNLVFATSDGNSIGAVRIYDTNGQVVFSNNAQGSKLIWNLRNGQGKRIANGVYFLRFEGTGKLKKIVVIR